MPASTRHQLDRIALTTGIDQQCCIEPLFSNPGASRNQKKAESLEF